MKTVIRTDRLRIPPDGGFSWLDRRFMHEFAPRLNRNGVYLYLFLTAVSDRSGLSYYRDSTIHNRTGMAPGEIASARTELLHHDLIAYRAPLYQVLSLPASREQQSAEPGATMSLGELMTSLAARRREGVCP